VVHLLICMALIGALTGCSPKLGAGLSAEDLQACDDVAVKFSAALDNFFAFDEGIVPHISLKPGIAEITSPANGSALPFGPVVIAFKQPPKDPGVDYRRNLQVKVRQIYTNDLQDVGNPYAVVLPSPTNLEIPWMPASPGKYIFMVLYRNLETTGEDITNVQMGAQLEVEQIAHGPYSLAYVCVQIETPKAGGAQSPQPVILMPLENLTTLVPTLISTATPLPTFTKPPTPTPTQIPATATFTLVPPTPRPPTRVPPTSVPPTEIVNCSAYGDADTCSANPVCTWGQLPSGAYACVDK
jgi:hypothetical protein